MSEEPANNRRYNFRKKFNGTVDNSQMSLDDLGDKIKASIKAITKKLRDSDKDLQAEYKKEKFKEDTKDY
jgi:hypothetical protein